MFQVDGQASPPHVVTGNKMRFEGVKDLVHFLYMWDDGKERRGLGSKPYRVIFQKSFELIERRLGCSRAERWLEEFFYLVRLTHWMLLYLSNTSLITTTKTSRSQGLRGRTIWFSAVYADPRHAQLPLRSASSTLGNIRVKKCTPRFVTSRPITLGFSNIENFAIPHILCQAPWDFRAPILYFLLSHYSMRPHGAWNF